MIERIIYQSPNINDDRASIHMYISPTPNKYTLYIDAVALNDTMFRLKIENIQRTHLENACMLVFNTLHMYWMPDYVCKDFIDYDDDVVSHDLPEFASGLFNNLVDKLILPHKRETNLEIEYLKGEIIVANANANELSFEWKRPLLNVYDDGNKNNIIEYDEHFELAKQFNRQRINDALHGFKYPRL